MGAISTRTKAITLGETEITEHVVDLSRETPAEADAWNIKGVRLFNARDYEGAVQAFSAALAIDPHFEAAYRCRAEALRRLGRRDEAVRDLSKAEPIKIAWQKKAAEEAAFNGRMSVPFVAAAYPVIGLSAISTARAAVLLGAPDWLTGMYLFWVVGVAVWALGILVAIGFAVARRDQVAREMMIGAGVGVAVLAATWVLHVALPISEFS